jgi:hypothetical protein
MKRLLLLNFLAVSEGAGAAFQNLSSALCFRCNLPSAKKSLYEASLYKTHALRISRFKVMEYNPIK